MVDVRFINDTTPISVEGEQRQTTVNVMSRSSISNVNVNPTGHHNTLSNRDLPDQHPIDAITGLREALSNADKTFVFEQGIASDTWEIEHNLNKRPSVTVVDSAENIITAEVEYIDDNNVVVRMNGATTGFAYLN